MRLIPGGNLYEEWQGRYTLWVERNGMTEQNETSLQQFPAFYGITATFVHITAVFRLSPLLCSSLA